MKRGLKIAITAVLALLVCSLLLWRLWPHSFADVISTDESTIISISCSSTISGVNDSGTPFATHHSLPSSEKGTEEFNAVLDIVKSCEYRPDFQNLLPWAITSYSFGGNKTAIVSLIWGNNPGDNGFLQFGVDGQVVVSVGSNKGFKVYHTTDDSILDTLVSFVQERGTDG